MRTKPTIVSVALAICLAGAFGVSIALAQDASRVGLTGQAALPAVADLAAVESEIPPGFMIVEGDIIVPRDFYDGRATYQVNLWTDGIVPYEFDANVSVANQNAMVGAMAVWEAAANVSFVLRTDEYSYLHIQNASFSNSFVGMWPIPGQEVNIANWNPNNRTMVHELGHALAFWHEQSRSDRDQYIQIEWDNILPGEEHNFDIYPGVPWPSDEYGPYDFGSIMHYGACAKSACSGVCTCGNPNCRTITVLPPNDVAWQCSLGQGLPPSFWDIRVMSFLYPQWDWPFVDIAWTGSENGTFLDPYQSALLGLGSTPTGGTLWFQPGNYLAVGTWSNAVTLRAPLGGVTLGLGG